MEALYSKGHHPPEMVCSLLTQQEKKTAFKPGPLVFITVPDNGTEPLVYVENLLTQAGFADAEALRRSLLLPESRCLCCEVDEGLVRGLAAANSREFDPEVVLWNAVVLGLCNRAVYGPERPVIWTNNRLSRKLQLFSPGDFYAD